MEHHYQAEAGKVVGAMRTVASTKPEGVVVTNINLGASSPRESSLAVNLDVEGVRLPEEPRHRQI